LLPTAFYPRTIAKPKELLPAGTHNASAGRLPFLRSHRLHTKSLDRHCKSGNACSFLRHLYLPFTADRFGVERGPSTWVNRIVALGWCGARISTRASACGDSSAPTREVAQHLHLQRLVIPPPFCSRRSPRRGALDGLGDCSGRLPSGQGTASGLHVDPHRLAGEVGAAVGGMAAGIAGARLDEGVDERGDLRAVVERSMLVRHPRGLGEQKRRASVIRFLKVRMAVRTGSFFLVPPVGGNGVKLLIF
jgi:hypothetical protein